VVGRFDGFYHRRSFDGFNDFGRRRWLNNGWLFGTNCGR
jgi:hypothetical protein